MPVAPLASSDWFAANVLSVLSGDRRMGSTLASKVTPSTLARIEALPGLVVQHRDSVSFVDGHHEREYVWAVDGDVIDAYWQHQDRAADSRAALPSYWVESARLYGYTDNDAADFARWIAPGGSLKPSDSPCPCVQCRPDLFGPWKRD